uniref:Uncharacterized protein n=1 Tax=Aegilops tauschii subsp. strangulata TaxID=200361 RepID=A0A453DV80_AEGTS
MATAYAPPMASQVMKSGLVCSKPRGLSGASLTRRPRFVVKAVKSDKVSCNCMQERAKIKRFTTLFLCSNLQVFLYLIHILVSNRGRTRWSSPSTATHSSAAWRRPSRPAPSSRGTSPTFPRTAPPSARSSVASRSASPTATSSSAPSRSPARSATRQFTARREPSAPSASSPSSASASPCTASPPSTRARPPPRPPSRSPAARRRPTSCRPPKAGPSSPEASSSAASPAPSGPTSSSTCSTSHTSSSRLFIIGMHVRWVHNCR